MMKGEAVCESTRKVPSIISARLLTKPVLPLSSTSNRSRRHVYGYMNRPSQHTVPTLTGQAENHGALR